MNYMNLSISGVLIQYEPNTLSHLEHHRAYSGPVKPQVSDFSPSCLLACPKDINKPGICSHTLTHMHTRPTADMLIQHIGSSAYLRGQS